MGLGCGAVRARSLSVGALCVAAIACHARATVPIADEARGDAVEVVDASTVVETPGDSGRPAAPGASGLRLSANPDRLCPGQCTTLTLSPMPGPASHHAWQPASLTGPGPHRVCPTRTTRYAVEVTSEAAGVEFGPVAQRADTTVTSRDDCDGSRGDDAGLSKPGDGDAAVADSGAASDGGAKDDPLAIPPPRADWGELSPPACQASFSATDQAVPIAVGGGERPIVVGWFRGALNVGATTLASGSAWMNGFIVRYDADCQPLWARSLFGFLYTVAFDVIEAEDGSLFVTGAMQGLADPGLGPIDSGDKRDLLLLRLDPNTGVPIWQRRFQTTETLGANQVWSFLGVDSTGHLRLHGRANHNTDLGLGPLGPPPVPGTGQTNQVDFLARIDTDGRAIESLPKPASGTFALAHDDSMRVAFRARGPVSFGASELGAGAIPYQALGMLGPTGAHGWHVVVEDGLPDTQFQPDSLAVDRDGTTYWSLTSSDPQAVYYTVAAVDVDGAPLWRSPVTTAFPREARGDIAHRVVVDGHGAAWVAGQVDGSLPVAGRAIVAWGERDIAVLRLGPDGQPDFGALVGTPGDDHPVLLHGLRSGAALVVYGNDGVAVRLARLVPAH